MMRFILLVSLSIVSLTLLKSQSCEGVDLNLFAQPCQHLSEAAMQYLVSDESRSGTITVLGASGKVYYNGPVNFGTLDVEFNELSLEGLSQMEKMTVTYSNANGCATTRDMVISVIPTYTVVANDVSCLGNADGEITISLTDPTMSVRWEDGSTSLTKLDLSSGSYEVTISTEEGCEYLESIEIIEPTTLTAHHKVRTVDCDGEEDRMFSTYPKGGTPPYTYSWVVDGDPINDNEPTIHDVKTYDVEVSITDKNGCIVQSEYHQSNTGMTASMSAQDVRIPPLSVDKSGMATYDLDQALDLAYGDADEDQSDGSIFKITYHEAMPHAMAGTQAMATSTVYSEQPETYYLRAQNKNSDCFAVAEIALQSGSYCLRYSEACDNDSPIELIALNCFDPTNSPPADGTFRIFRREQPGNTNGEEVPDALVFINNRPHFDPQNNEGSYNVTYTYDDGGGEVTLSAFFEVQALNFGFSISQDTVCGNGDVFQIIANPIGGFLLGDGVIDSVVSGTNQIYLIDPSQLDINSTELFTYRYSQSNNSGLVCTDETRGFVYVEPFPEIDILVDTEVQCAGTLVDQTATVSNPSIVDRYEWTDGTTTVVGTELDLLLPNIQSSTTFRLTAFTGSGCSSFDEVQINVDPLPILTCNAVSFVQCPGGNDGIASVDISGASDYGEFGFEWSTGSTDRMVSGLSAGDYKVIVTTPDRCVDSCVVTVESPTSFDILCDINVTAPLCAGASNASTLVEVANGGTPPYMYSRDNITFTTNNLVTGYGSGLQRVYIQDAVGCIDSCFFTVPSTPDLNCEIIPSSVSTVSCPGDSDGSATVSASGGTGPYTYQWDNGETTARATGLAPGERSVVVRDANGCATTCNVVIGEPSPLQCDIRDILDPACNGQASGSAQVYILGGTSPYSITWSTGDTTNIASNLAADTYTVEVTDANGCTTSCMVTLDEPTPLTANPSSAEVCQGQMVLISANADPRVVTHTWAITGGSASGAVLEQPLQSTAKVNAMQADPGTVTLSYRGEDINGCVVTANTTITILEAPASGSDNEVTVCNVRTDEYIVDLNTLLSSNANTSGVWSFLDGASAIDLVDPSAVAFECAPAGPYRFIYIVNGRGVCTGDTATITINVENCFDLAIRKRAVQPTILSPDDPVEFTIEIFNQGDVTAHEVAVTDYIESYFNLDTAKNTQLATGNPADWVTTTSSRAKLQVGTIAPGASRTVSIFLDLDPTYQGIIMYNSAEVTDYGIRTVSGAIKYLPPDEDDLGVDRPYPNETDDEISDDQNGGVDDPLDEDRFDFAEVVLCGSIARQMSCNDLVTISLDDDCEVLVTADMILEGPHIGRFDVVLRDLDGNILPNPLGVEHLGMEIEATVIDACGPNTCWGKIFLEDKLGPEITCIDDFTLSCLQTDYSTLLPQAVDACEGLLDVVISRNDLVRDNCGTSYRATRTISYYAEDSKGNVSDTCTFSIFYDSIAHDQIAVEESIVLECDEQSIWDSNGNYYPDPFELGAPTVNGEPIVTYPTGNISDPVYDNYCNINANFEDTRHDICARSYSLHRRWTLLDWCNGTLLNYNQIIVVADTKAPEAEVSTPLAILTTSSSTCTADYVVEAPVITAECGGETSYRVRYRLATADPNSTEEGIYIDDNVLQLADGRYVIRDLPLGMTALQYLIIDGCGNNTTIESEILVVDEVQPTPVCDENTAVTLTSGGIAEVSALTFDDGSHDNCGPVSYEARRLDNKCGNSTAFGEFVSFCCADVGQVVMVELRVWDDANGNGVFGDVITRTLDSNNSGVIGDIINGVSDETRTFSDLSNVCMVSVTIQDKVDPTILCPADITINCGQDYKDFTITGTADSDDNCGTSVVTHEDVVLLDQCGVGEVRRTFTVSDQGGRSKTCSQVITIRNEKPFDFNDNNDLEFPEDVNLQGCIGEGYDVSQTGEPIISEDACDLVASTYSDQIFPMADTACFRVHRTFTVIDWCQFDQNDPTQGIRRYVQTIYVQNSIAPTINNCADTTVCIFGEGCDGLVTIAANATDDCTDASLLQYVLRVDIDNDGTDDINATQAELDVILAPGQHRVYWQVADRCGNVSNCSYILSVSDCKEPTPYCRSEVTTVLMPSNGMITVTAEDFDLGSFDNCDGPLAFSFDEQGMSPTKTFICDDLGLNELQLWVTDQAGNKSFCETWIDIQSNGDCDASRVGGHVTGVLTTDVGVRIPMVDLQLEQKDGGELQTALSDSLGAFDFVNLEHGTYSVIAADDDDHAEGVSTLDLVLIQRHILGLATLDSPQKVLAADVNNSESVSGADVVALRQLILGITDRFDLVQSWTFLDAGSPLDNTRPWSANDEVLLEIDADSTYLANMVGIKMGDVNSSCSDILNMRSTDAWTLVAHTAADATAEQHIEVSSADLATIAGYQMTIRYDASCHTLLRLEAGLHPISEAHYHEVEPGVINISVDLPEPITTKAGEALFEIILDISDNDHTCSITLDESALASEAYDEALTIRPLTLVTRDSEIDQGEVVLMQNVPNPFGQQTAIEFYIPEDDEVHMTVYHVNGALLLESKARYTRGYHRVELSSADLQYQSGMLYYQITTNGVTKTKKMLSIR